LSRLIRARSADSGARIRPRSWASRTREPPFDEHRFGAPVPRATWTPQRKALAEITTIPEPSIPGNDILTLNVFTPRPSQSAEPLPVMVYIHGGGYVAGSPASHLNAAPPVTRYCPRQPGRLVTLRLHPGVHGHRTYTCRYPVDGASVGWCSASHRAATRMQSLSRGLSALDARPTYAGAGSRTEWPSLALNGYGWAVRG
jgi:hypothetical protein